MKRRKIFNVLKYWSFSCLLFSHLTSNALAADFSSGAGVISNPYVILTAEELNSMRENLGAHYKLGADIDLTSWINVNAPITGWTPIGTLNAPFTGSLNGDGHVIENIWINSDAVNVGFFGAISGEVTIRKIGIIVADGKKITGSSNVGILTGLSVGLSGGNKQTCIEEVYVSGNVESKGALVGAIVGQNSNQNITIINSYAKGNILSASDGTGGIIGSSYGGCTTLIDKCYVLSSITVEGGGSMGGILGTVSASDVAVNQMNATVSNCVAINKSLKMRDATPYRIAAWAKQEKLRLLNNLAFSGCTINDAPFSSSDASGKNGKDKDADELASQITYDNWNFESVWKMGNDSFQLPILKSINHSKQPIDTYNLGIESDNPFVDLVPKGGELNVVESCGVSTNGRDDVTDLIQQAIDACSVKKATVVIPNGRYAIRPIFLRSNMTLKLEEGAQLIGSRMIQDYRNAFPSAGAIETSALVFGKNIENVKVIGKGIINGRGDAPEFNFGNGKGDRPKVLHFVECKDVVVEGITLQNSAFWTAHFLMCDGVKIKGVKIYSHTNWNNDGLDIDSRNVVVEDCYIDCDDDAICLKSDRGILVENVTVRNCSIRTNCNAIKLGTAGKSGFKNITYVDCVIEKASEDNFRKHYENNALAFCGITVNGPSVIAGIALESVNGGVLDGVTIENIKMKDVHTPIFLRLGKREGSLQMSELKNVLISNIQAVCVSKVASSIMGVPGGIIENVKIRNVAITLPGGGTESNANASVPEKIDGYPESNMFGTPLPAHGFYVRHAKDIFFENVKFNLQAPDARPAYKFDDVIGYDVTGISFVSEEQAFQIVTENGELKISSNAEDILSVEIVDMSGKVVYTSNKVYAPHGGFNIPLPQQGMYVLMLHTQKGNFIQKIVNH